MYPATNSSIKAAKIGPVVLAIALAGSLVTWRAAPTEANEASRTTDQESGAGNQHVLQELDVLRRLNVVPLDSLPAIPTLQDYIGYAAAHNEELQASLAQWQALTERVPQATSLPDPMFRYSEFLVPVETRVGPQNRAFGLAQTFPWFGTLSERGKVEEERVAAAAAKVSNVALNIAFKVSHAYFELAYLSSAIEINDEHLSLLTQWEEVARSKYATGSGGYADVIKSQVEIGKLSDRVAELRDRYRPLAAELNAALNRPSNAHVDWPAKVGAEGPTINEAELLDRLSTDNPELISLGHETVRYRHAESLAGKQGLPNFTLGLSYIQTGDAEMPGVADSGKDPVIATLAVNVPLWRGKYSAAEREAAVSYLAARATLQERENALTVALERALFGYRDAIRKLNLYGDTLLPKGYQSLYATLSAYETGTAGFLDLVDAERLLLEFELSDARAAVDLMIRLAEIEKLVGGPVEPGGNNARR